MEAKFIQEVNHLELLANIVMVKKANGRWRMGVNVVDLNIVFPKDLQGQALRA